MTKSINDLRAQVSRIVAMVDERGGWRAVHPGWRLDDVSLHQVAGPIAARRGLSLFGDYDIKGEWRAEMMKPYPLPPPTEAERRAIEHKVNNACDEADMARVLRFVAKSIMIRKEFLTDLDPLAVPKRIIAEMQALLPRKSTRKMNDKQLSLPFFVTY